MAGAHPDVAGYISVYNKGLSLSYLFEHGLASKDVRISSAIRVKTHCDDDDRVDRDSARLDIQVQTDLVLSSFKTHIQEPTTSQDFTCIILAILQTFETKCRFRHDDDDDGTDKE